MQTAQGSLYVNSTRCLLAIVLQIFVSYFHKFGIVKMTTTSNTGIPRSYY